MTQQSKPMTGSYYTIRSGDTLSSIAMTAYGNSNDWQTIAIASQNQMVLGSNPTADQLLPVGEKLYIPPLGPFTEGSGLTH